MSGAEAPSMTGGLCEEGWIGEKGLGDVVVVVQGGGKV